MVRSSLCSSPALFHTIVLWKLAFCAAQPAQPPWNRDRRLLYVSYFETRRKSVSCPGFRAPRSPRLESLNVRHQTLMIHLGTARNRSSHCRTLERPSEALLRHAANDIRVGKTL